MKWNFIQFFALFLVTQLAACTGGCSNPKLIIQAPEPFTFSDKTAVAFNTVIISNTVTISGINAASPISIFGGEYSIDGGNYTSANGLVFTDQTVTLRLLSSSTPVTFTDATVTIAGISDTFSVETKTDSKKTDSVVIDSITTTVTITDITPPNANILFPPRQSRSEGDSIIVRGFASDKFSGVATVRVNGIDAFSDDGFASWWVEIPLDSGYNYLTLDVADHEQNYHTNSDTLVRVETPVINDSVSVEKFRLDPDNINMHYMMGLTTIYDRINNRKYSLNKTSVWVNDLSSRTMTMLSNPRTPDTAHALISAVSFILDSVNDRLLVIDNKLKAIVAVDLTTGKRTILSKDLSKDDSNYFKNIAGFILDRANNRALLLSRGSTTESASLFTVNLETGRRTILSDNSTPNALNAFGYPIAMRLHKSNKIAFVRDSQLKAIIAVDLVNGQRVIAKIMNAIERGY